MVRMNLRLENDHEAQLSQPQSTYNQLVQHMMVLSDGAISEESACNARDVRDVSSTSGYRGSHEGRHGNPLQYSCLENPTDRGTWRAIVHRVTKSQTCLKQLSTHK